MANLVGLSFPFQINSKGGLSLVEQSRGDNTIFENKLAVLLNTNKGERTMECDVFANLDVYLFNPNNTSTRTLIEYQIKEAVRKHIPEIELVSCNIQSVGKVVWAVLEYKVRAYETTNTASLKVGVLD